MVDGDRTDAGRPLTTGWKVAIVAALVTALVNSGVASLRSQEERRFQNHEMRVDDLENKVRELQAALATQQDQAPGKGE